MPWTDYPQAATDNAKRALKIREEEGTDCGTPVGWESARIIANKEAITKQRLPRVYSFLSRAKTYDQGNFKDEDGKQICGSIMYAAWGGDEMHRWAERTLSIQQALIDAAKGQYAGYTGAPQQALQAPSAAPMPATRSLKGGGGAGETRSGSS